MDNKRWYVLSVNPEPWAVGPLGTVRSKHTHKIIPTMGRNASLAAYQAAVQDEISMLNPEKLAGHTRVRFYFWRNQATYLTPQARFHRKHEADTTNLNKALEDALQDILYDNDKDVQKIEGTIVAQGPDVHPCIAISIEPYQGLNPDEIPTEVWIDIEKVQMPLIQTEVKDLFEDDRGDGIF